MLANDSVADRLRLKVSLLPDLPGCYLYLDSEGKVIYVGKAKRLRRRVSSYFNREHDSLKTRMLVRHIADLNYVVVGSEDDALHLENALIKSGVSTARMPIPGWRVRCCASSKRYFPCAVVDLPSLPKVCHVENIRCAWNITLTTVEDAAPGQLAPTNMPYISTKFAKFLPATHSQSKTISSLKCNVFLPICASRRRSR